MRVAVLGAGALGSILAGHLARSGKDVTLIARGNRASFLQEHGISITGLADFSVPCPVISDPADLKSADVLIVTVKTYDMASAAASLRHADIGSVLSVQNGVLKEEQLAEAFGKERTLGATTVLSGELLPEGAVRFTFNQGVYIGEMPAGLSPRVEQLVTTLTDAGIQTQASPDIQSVVWSKFVGWLGCTAVAVLTRLESHKFFSDPDVALMLARLMRECADLAAKRGIVLKDMVPVPVKSVRDGTESQAVAKLQEMGAIMREKAPKHRMSSLQDLERGRALEVEETLGYVVTNAAKEGVPVPTVEMCYRLISGINRTVVRT
jgi:2-dehydropantoate 2-reductase